MIPQRFARANIVMQAPKDMENCCDIHACKAVDQTGAPITLTCWRPTPQELVLINLGNPIWLSVWGNAFPPVCVSAEDPFEVEEKET